MTGFIAPVDIANRGIQRVGLRKINLMTDTTVQAVEMNACYDKLRRAELRRAVWRFSTRRAPLQPITATSQRFIPAPWLVGTTYAAGAVVKDSNGIYWISVVAGNVGNTPGTAPALGVPTFWQQYFGPVVCDLWSGTTAYNAGDLVYKSGPVFYLCTANNSLNQDPVGGAPWVVMPGSPTNRAIVLLQPAGPGLTVNGQARNMFPLPYGYLRATYQDPKVAGSSVNATSGGLQFSDWQFEGDYIISASTTALLLRFVADVQDVTAMDDLFCEGLAARMAFETCERLTNSNVKLQAIGQAYTKFIRDARLINWIETASTEKEEDEYELTSGPQNVTEGPSAAQQQG